MINLTNALAEEGLPAWKTPLGQKVLKAMDVHVHGHLWAFWHPNYLGDLYVARTAGQELSIRNHGRLPILGADGLWYLQPSLSLANPPGASYDAALVAECARLLGIVAEPAVPDRTGEWYCTADGERVYTITGPPVDGRHPNNSLRPFTEAELASGEYRRIPPAPACPADKKLTTINLDPQQGDKVVNAWSEPCAIGNYDYLVVGSGDAGINLAHHPLYGTARWGWEYVEKPQHPAPKYKAGDWKAQPAMPPLPPQLFMSESEFRSWVVRHIEKLEKERNER